MNASHITAVQDKARRGNGSEYQGKDDEEDAVVVNLFVRQCFTESTATEQAFVQSILDMVAGIKTAFAAAEHPVDLNVLTGLQAESGDTFRTAFTQQTGAPFTPTAFRRHRMKLLSQADCMLVVRTGLSESGAFEISYNAYAGNSAPIFFAIWDQTPIKTTLLRDLEEICPGTVYHTFSQPHDDNLQRALTLFLKNVAHPINGPKK